MPPGYACVVRAEWLRRYRDTVLPTGAHVWYKGDDGFWWFGKINASTTEDGVYLVRVLDDLGPIKFLLGPARYTTSTGAIRGSWCLKVHVASAFSRGVQRNVDDSRGAGVISRLPHRRHAQQFPGFVGSPPWLISGSFCVLGSEFSPWVGPGAFCVLRSSFFSLCRLRCLGIVNVRSLV